MSHSDAEFSLDIRDLLCGASALTATGLSPASSMQHEPPDICATVRSGRTTGGIVTAHTQVLHETIRRVLAGDAAN